MSYVDDIKRVATAHAEEIRAHLDLARHRLREERNRTAELEREVAALDGLIALLGESQDDAGGAPPMTLHGAMVAVLREQQLRMLRPSDLLAEINRRRLYRMRDGRPVELQQIHARVGNYPQLFIREGTFIKLVDA